MAINGSIVKVVWGGKLFNTEEWSCSIHMGSLNTLEPNPSIFAPALLAWMANSSSGVSGAAHLDFIKANRIDPLTGRYADPTASHTYEVTTSPTGGTAAGPGQLSSCITLATAATRGRASKGRFFAPTGFESVLFTPAEGRLTQNCAAQMADSAKTLLTAFNALANTGEVVVFSKIGQMTRKVTAVRAGRVIDTQRARRSSLDELYEVATLA